MTYYKTKYANKKWDVDDITYILKEYSDGIPEKVISDIKEGYVSNESGEIDYGVVLCEDKFEVDAEATNSLRKEIIRTRLKTMDS